MRDYMQRSFHANTDAGAFTGTGAGAGVDGGGGGGGRGDGGGGGGGGVDVSMDMSHMTTSTTMSMSLGGGSMGGGASKGVGAAYLASTRKLLLICIGVLAFLVCAAVVFMGLEGWTFVTALYFAVQTTTVSP
jgi:hypothetical protein